MKFIPLDTSNEKEEIGIALENHHRLIAGGDLEYDIGVGWTFKLYGAMDKSLWGDFYTIIETHSNSFGVVFYNYSGGEFERCA